MRTDINEYYLRMAKVAAMRSTCLDKKVGCILVDDTRRVVAVGYNGAPSSALHCTDLKSCAKEAGEPCRALHAEANALQYCKGRPLVCYCTLEPCSGCAKLLRNAGVKVVYYINKTSAEKSGMKDFNGEWRQYPDVLSDHGKMDSIVKRIRRYHGRLGYPTLSPDEDTRFMQGRDIMLAMNQEVAELTDSFDWKPWRKYGGQRAVNVDNMLEEAGDIIFFIDSLLMNFGLSWDQLAARMDTKLNEVHRRIEDGYHK